ncbi:MAG: ester cyclase [Dehalococcoidia bacterium]|nr:ester cyclase [Dehalococcoidia bacterium]
MAPLTQENETVIRRLFQEVSVKMLPSAETADFKKYTVLEKSCCLEDFGDFFAGLRCAFRDCRLNIKSIAAKGDKVMVHYTVCGMQKGDFLGVSATGEKMVVIGIDVFRLNEGKVVQHWDAAHQLSVAR